MVSLGVTGASRFAHSAHVLSRSGFHAFGEIAQSFTVRAMRNFKGRASSGSPAQATRVAASDNRDGNGASEPTHEFGAADGACAVRVTSVSAQNGGTN
jgi:hypothetical protein